MNRDEALQLMSLELYRLLGLMFAQFKVINSRTGFPRASAGFATGGSVSSFEDLDHNCSTDAADVLSVAWWQDLTQAEQVSVEMAMGIRPMVWTVRPGVYEAAVAKLERKLREIVPT